MVQDWSELTKTTGLGHGKVRGDKLAPDRGYRSNRLLGKKVSSFLLQHLIGRTRDFWILRP